MVSHIESTDEIYLQLSKSSVELESLLDRLEEFYSTSQVASAIKSEIPVCVNVNNIWNRATVLSIDDENNSATVQLVDIGTKHSVSLDDVRQLDNEFLQLEPLAFKCRLFASQACFGIYNNMFFNILFHCYLNLYFKI